MVRNICLTIEYDGTRFRGWQTQSPRDKRSGIRDKHRTVQGEIEKAGKKLFGKDIKVIGAGRTDSGVHAEGQVANFRINSNLPPSNIKKGLNSHLPKDVATLSAEDVSADFHSQYNAKEKLYRYTILNRKTRSPLLMRHAALVSYDLNAGAMREGAVWLLGKKDFRSFQASDKRERSSVRTISRLSIVSTPPVMNIYIQADGFLYNMVRNITGTLIDVGRGRTKPQKVKEILEKKHRAAAGQTAPAKGLCLVKVIYQ